jgi:hypothetical protein
LLELPPVLPEGLDTKIDLEVYMESLEKRKSVLE